jgi:hypothetical protein
MIVSVVEGCFFSVLVHQMFVPNYVLEAVTWRMGDTIKP